MNVGARVMGVEGGGGACVLDAPRRRGGCRLRVRRHRRAPPQGHRRRVASLRGDGRRRRAAGAPAGSGGGAGAPGFVEATWRDAATGWSRRRSAPSCSCSPSSPWAGPSAAPQRSRLGHRPGGSSASSRWSPRASAKDCTGWSPAAGEASVTCHRPSESYAVTYSSWLRRRSPGGVRELRLARGPHEPRLRQRHVRTGGVHGERHHRGRRRLLHGGGYEHEHDRFRRMWTDEGSLVLGQATRGDAADLTLYEWWRTEAGPWSSDAHPEKDGDGAAPGAFREVGGPRLLMFGDERSSGAWEEKRTSTATRGFMKPCSASRRCPMFSRLPLPRPRRGALCRGYRRYDWRLRSDCHSTWSRAVPRYQSEEVTGRHAHHPSGRVACILEPPRGCPSGQRERCSKSA